MMYSKSLWFDIEHVRSALGWQPRYSNAEMLADSYDWFLGNRASTAESGRSHHRTIARQGALKVLKTATRLLPR
jgi:dTDP-D-glucose 4,6-dehydratase